MTPACTGSSSNKRSAVTATARGSRCRETSRITCAGTGRLTLRPFPCRAHESMTGVPDHISVCICTFRRPHLLTRLLEELIAQETDGLFTYSIVVADNDESQSAGAVVRNFATRSAVPIVYCIE